MGERRIYEIQYPSFRAILRQANKNLTNIEKKDKEAWMAYVRKHNVPEAAMMSRGKTGTMFGNLSVVIIVGEGEADGYYVHSADEGFCLKFESGDS